METAVKTYLLSNQTVWWLLVILLAAHTATILYGIVDFGKGRFK